MRALVVAAVTGIAVAACSQKTGGEFIGRWRTDNPRSTEIIEFQRDGNGFIMIRSAPSFMSGKPETTSFPARLVNDTMHVTVPSGATAVLSIDPGRKTLNFGGKSYTRVSS